MTEEDRPKPDLQALRQDLDEKWRRHRNAVRWMGDAKRFRADFGAEDWKETSLSDIAKITYDEAVEEVLNSRAALVRARDRFREASIEHF